MGFMKNKRALITGVASDRSIAYGIAKAMHAQGCELAFTCQNDKLKSRVEKFAAEFDSSIVIPCDVSSDSNIEEMYTELGKHWDGFDILIHAIAFAAKEELEGLYLDVATREGFLMAHEISSYSFTALAKGARPMMQGRQGAMLTLTYIGAVRSMPNYNVMGLAKASLEANVRYLAQSLGGEGIRVNGISAGPIRTLAASGIKNFRKMLAYYENTVPLGRCITTEEVGNTAAFLCSDLASGITSEITYVDGGFSTIGLSEKMMGLDKSE